MAANSVRGRCPVPEKNEGNGMWRRNVPKDLGGNVPTAVVTKAIQGSPPVNSQFSPPPPPKSSQTSNHVKEDKSIRKGTLKVTINRETKEPKGVPGSAFSRTVPRTPLDSTDELVRQVVDEVLDTLIEEVVKQVHEPEGGNAMLPAPKPSTLVREADTTGLIKPNDETDGFVVISPRKNYPVTEETRRVFDVV